MPHPSTALFPIDVPLMHKRLDQLDEQVSLIRINLDDDVNVPFM
jgi:hypothetical protein